MPVDERATASPSERCWEASGPVTATQVTQAISIGLKMVSPRWCNHHYIKRGRPGANPPALSDAPGPTGRARISRWRVARAPRL